MQPPGMEQTDQIVSLIEQMATDINTFSAVRTRFPLLWIVAAIPLWFHIERNPFVRVGACLLFPIATILSRAMLIVYIRWVDDFQRGFMWWFFVLAMVTTSPIELHTVRAFINQHQAEMLVPQGAYNRLLGRWRRSIVDSLRLFHFNKNE